MNSEQNILYDASKILSHLLFTTRISTSNHQLRHLIRSIKYLSLPRNLTRRAAIARWHIQRWVLGEEIPRSQQQSHRFRWHYGEILWGWEMSDAECVPEHDVGIVDGCVSVGNPFRDTAGRLAGCLRHVAASRIDLLVIICQLLVGIVVSRGMKWAYIW